MLEAIDKFRPDLVTNHSIETALSLVRLYDLHLKPKQPVDIGPLLESFELRFEEDLPETTWGFTLDLNHKIIITINGNLSTELARYVAVHEIGHVSCWHPNQLHACVQGRVLYDTMETEASTVAAYVLVPREAVTGPPLSRKAAVIIAAQYQVPPELVLVRQQLFYLSGGF
jgi:Zn-dependent peptidase ImmA (M78 family)